MEWTKDPPTKTGYYLIRTEEDSQPRGIYYRSVSASDPEIQKVIEKFKVALKEERKVEFYGPIHLSSLY